jgi:hypothetical protein
VGKDTADQNAVISAVPSPMSTTRWGAWLDRVDARTERSGDRLGHESDLAESGLVGYLG